MKRFRWTRRKYERAHRLNRLLTRWYQMPAEPPAMVRRYLELWEQYPERGDPLLIPVAYRYDPEIPF